MDLVGLVEVLLAALLATSIALATLIVAIYRLALRLASGLKQVRDEVDALAQAIERLTEKIGEQSTRAPMSRAEAGAIEPPSLVGGEQQFATSEWPPPREEIAPILDPTDPAVRQWYNYLRKYFRELKRRRESGGEEGRDSGGG